MNVVTGRDNVNVCRDMRRRAWFRYIDRTVDVDHLRLEAEAPPGLALMQEIMRLPRREMEAVLLYYYEDMLQSEIARMLNISEAAVSKRLLRARRMLKDVLEGGAAQLYREGEERWYFAVLADGCRTAPQATSDGTCEDGRVRYSGSVSLSGETDSVTFVPCRYAHPESRLPDSEVYSAQRPVTGEQTALSFTVKAE